MQQPIYNYRYKTPYRYNSTATPEHKRDEIIKLREAGLPFSEIASMFHLTRQRVHQIWCKAVAI